MLSQAVNKLGESTGLKEPPLARDPISWSDPKVEPQINQESDKIASMHEIINKVQAHNFSHHRHGFRGTHVKSQAIVKGTLTVLPDLAPSLSQGIFSKPGQEYPIAIRYANEPSFLQDDREPGPRGCGLKVFNVSGPGPFLSSAGESSQTQDFTFNNAPILELTDLPTCVEIFGLREKYFDDPKSLEKELAKRKDAKLQFAPKQLPNQHFMSYTMYSQSAYRFGEYVVKYALFPSSELQQKLGEQYEINQDSSREQHSIWLREFFQKNDANFDFKVQLCRNLDEQSVEDCSMEWDESRYPFETVAKVVLPKGQDVFGAERRAFWDDKMKLNVWYGLEAHQPLGSVNRLRKTLYEASVKKRAEVNVTEVKYISSIDEIP